MTNARINWNKIDTITYNYNGMSDEAIVETKKAIEIMDECEYRGEKSKAAYIRRRLEEKKDYIMH